MNLDLLWEASGEGIGDVDFTFHHISNNMSCFSTIDHFACSEGLKETILEANVIHSGLNMSNHFPIYVKFNISSLDKSV